MKEKQNPKQQNEEDDLKIEAGWLKKEEKRHKDDLKKDVMLTSKWINCGELVSKLHTQKSAAEFWIT